MLERDVFRGERSLATPASPATQANLWARLSLRLTSARAILIAVPALVALVALLLTLTSFREMRAIGRAEAVESFHLGARNAEATLATALSGADSLLDRARDLTLAHSSDADVQPFAVRLRDLAVRRPGLKWLSASFPDGTFQGVFVERSGELSFRISRPIAGEETYRFAGDALRAAGRASSAYDPRNRDFYRLAREGRKRFWTAPYPFEPDFCTGITRAEAVFTSEGALHAVITADYDLNELSGLWRSAEPGTRLVAFTPEGSILALHASEVPRATAPPSSTRALAFADLRGSVLQDFFATRGAHAGGVGAREFSAGSGRYLAVERALNVAPDLRWRLAAVIEEQTLLAHANRQIRRSQISSGIAILFAALTSVVFAAGIKRLTHARNKAEQRASAAVDEARDLGSYRLEALIGSGGMGQVWRAKHRLLARPAAIKLIRTDLPGLDAGNLESRFEREAQQLARMRSPHTVSLFDFGKTTDGRLFLVMELLDGLTLDRAVRERGPLPVARVVPILIGVCRSLAEAHAAGLVHRDIKPANVFLCHDGEGVERAKVIDFGLAKQPRGPGLTEAGRISGTTEYMSPEQARGEPTDGRADIYSLACTAFYLLAGQPPFDRGSDVATLLAHQSDPPPSLAASTSQWIPPELDRLLTRCLAKVPQYRPPSAAAVARALEALAIPEAHKSHPDAVKTWWESVSAELGSRQ